MATFQNQIVEYIGADTDTDAITDILTAGAKKIVDLIPQEKLEKWAKAISVGALGTTITGYRLFRDSDGFRAYDGSRRGCITVKSGLAYNVGNSNSLHYAPATNPACYILNQKIYILPSGGSVDGVAYPTVLYSESSIADFPSEWTQGVVLYAAIQRAYSKLNTAITDLDGLSLGTITAPTTTFSATNINTYINTNKDIELGEGEINHQKAILDKYMGDLNLYSQNIQKAVSEYSNNLQRDFKTVENYILIIRELRNEYNEIVKAIQ